MARTRRTEREVPDSILTWTRFYLPEGQEWPTWSLGGTVIYPPLENVQGFVGLVSLGRMVDHPTQAAYILGE